MASDIAIDYGGTCARCGERHAVGLTEATAEAAQELLQLLSRSDRLPTAAGSPPGPPMAPRMAKGSGQMIGVLLARRPDATTLRLHAFSGAWDGQAQLPGWAPPLAFPGGLPTWRRAGAARLDALGAVIAAERVASAPERARLEAAIAERERVFTEELAELRVAQRLARAERATQRRALSASEFRSVADRSAGTHLALDAASRLERRRLRELRRRHRCELVALQELLERLQATETGLRDARRALSRQLMARIHAAYRIPDRSGALHPLTQAFLRPEAMPSGVGDCCAPKLLAWASRRGYEPLGLAEFWFGDPPPAGGRQHGAFYGACARACQPLLGFMLCPKPLDEGGRSQPALAPRTRWSRSG